MEHNETTNRATSIASTPTATTPELPSTPKPSKQDALKPEVQPPLPTYPPPPDKPPNMCLTLKEQRRQCNISHLVGIYTFCWNFQNSVCTHPNCKYVHATVFEEQRFYRTGELPPHVLAYHKNVKIWPPPPPPPEEAPSDIQTMFNNPPPPLPVSVEKQTPVICCQAARKMDFAAMSAAGTNTPSLKREWANIKNSDSSSPEDQGFDPDRLPKRCKNCDLRKKIMKEKFKKMELRQKIEKTRNKVVIIKIMILLALLCKKSSSSK
ncbi:unnamed protein product, partial [Iphiclides podalirius]